ncbi:MAG: aldo/keto reductase [Cyclobacteriaceae bacterium]|nr:aldo/keto reductase [Cyclobacteriaceae bacterium]
MDEIGRREALSRLSVLALLPLLGLRGLPLPLMKRTIPGTTESLPVVGVGTWQTFDVAPEGYPPLREVLSTLVSEGGSVIDSSPMYGKSEEVVGQLSEELRLNDKLFIATKVWTTGHREGINQMSASMAKLRRNRIDLMQIHNLVDWQNHMRTLTKWKEEGRIRYMGLTHYTDSAHDTLASVMKSNRVDFIQVNYNLLDRHAEERLLPLAQDLNVGVLINRPFEEGALFNRVNGKKLPEWAAEFDCASWGQFFLKFILSHPAVTCVIPGTSKAKHLLDNLGAGTGRLPDASQRKKMIDWIRNL